MYKLLCNHNNEHRKCGVLNVADIRACGLMTFDIK